MKELWTRFMQDESGQGLVEYILIIAVVALGLVAALLLFRNSVGRAFQNAATELDQQPGNAWTPGAS